MSLINEKKELFRRKYKKKAIDEEISLVFEPVSRDWQLNQVQKDTPKTVSQRKSSEEDMEPKISVSECSADGKNLKFTGWFVAEPRDAYIVVDYEDGTQKAVRAFTKRPDIAAQYPQFSNDGYCGLEFEDTIVASVNKLKVSVMDGNKRIARINCDIKR